jgi:hypothetical protein
LNILLGLRYKDIQVFGLVILNIKAAYKEAFLEDLQVLEQDELQNIRMFNNYSSDASNLFFGDMEGYVNQEYKNLSKKERRSRKRKFGKNHGNPINQLFEEGGN